MTVRPSAPSSIRFILLIALTRTLPSAAAAPAQAGTFERLALQVASKLKNLDPPLAVFVEGPSAPANHAFASALCAVPALAALSCAVVSAPSLEDAETRARGIFASTLLHLTLSSSQNGISAKGEAAGIRRNFWSGRFPSRRPGTFVAVSEQVDSQAAGLLASDPKPGGPTLNLHRLSPLPEAAGGLGTGDLDGDGKEEIAVLLSSQVWVLGCDGSVRAKLELPNDMPALRPSRDPFGILALLSAERALVVASGKHSQAMRWDTKRTPALLEPQNAKTDAVISQGGVIARSTWDGARDSLGTLWRLPSTTLRLPKDPVALSFAGKWALAVFPNGEGWLLDNFQMAGARKFSGMGSASVVLESEAGPRILTTESQVSPIPERLRLLSSRPDEAPLANTQLSGPARFAAPLRCEKAGAVVSVELPEQTGAELWRVEVTP